MNKNNKFLINSILIMFVIFSIIVPRFLEKERPVTTDELKWMGFGADFYNALGQREFDKTYYDHHPGVTTMIATSLAVHVIFPEYRGLGLGYYNDDVYSQVRLMEEHGIDPLSILILARQLMTAGVVLALLVSFWILTKLFGNTIAFFGIIFIALDPFHIGHSRPLTHDGLMSTLAMLSFLSWLLFRRENKIPYLILSALGGALALSTKVTAGFLLLFVLAYEIHRYSLEKKNKSSKTKVSFFRYFLPFIKWIGIMSIIFYVIWPAMWFNPFGTVYDVIEQSISQFGQGGGEKTDFLKLIKPNFFILSGFVKSLFGRTTLISWVGFIYFVYYIANRKLRNSIKENYKDYIFILLYPIVFLFFFSIVSRSLYAHYIMQAHTFSALISGIGFGFLYIKLSENFKNKKYSWSPVIILSVILIMQISQIIPEYPYYFTYRNPLTPKSVAINGYSALLDVAGDYLSAKPNAKDLVVMSWYGPDSFSFFFSGTTLPLWPGSTWSEININKLKQSDYLVLYVGSFGRKNLSYFMDIMKNVEPEKIISFQGNDFVWIYPVIDLPPEVYLPDN